MKNSNSLSIDKKRNVSSIVKGSMIAISVSLVLILLFALLIRFTGLPDSAIMPVNQLIKVISLFFGIRIALKTNRQKGWLKGLIIGLIYTILAYLVFSILSGKFNINFTSFNDLIFGTLLGGIIGIILINIKK